MGQHGSGVFLLLLVCCYLGAVPLKVSGISAVCALSAESLRQVSRTWSAETCLSELTCLGKKLEAGDAKEARDVPQARVDTNFNGTKACPSELTCLGKKLEAGVDTNFNGTKVELPDEVVDGVIEVSSSPDEEVVDGVIKVSSSPHVTWEGWGTSLCWWASFEGGLAQDDLDNLLDLVFDAQKGLGLNIARYNLGGGANKSFDVNLRPFSDIPGFQDTPGGSFNWSADERQRNVLLGAVERGVDVVEAFSNSPPYWMTYSGSVTGNLLLGQENLNPLYYEAFGDYLTEVVRHYRDAWGIEFHSLEPFNEPVEGWWYINRTKQGQEGCNFSPEGLENVTLHVQHLLRQKGLSTNVSGFDAWMGGTVDLLKTMGEEALATVQQVNVHSYIRNVSREEDTNRTQVRDGVYGLGKKLWMSEYGPMNWRGDDMEVALGIARHLTLDLNELQPSAWCHWQALDSGGVWGQIQAPFNHDTVPFTVQRKKQFFAVMHFSRWIRPGFEIFVPKSEQSFVVIARNTTGGNVVLVVTNPSSDTNKDIRFNVSRISPTLRSGALQVALFQTNVSHGHEELPRLFFETSIITVRCNVSSITTLVVSAI